MQYVQMGPETKFSRIVQGLWRLTGGLQGDWGLSTGDLIQFLEERFALGVTTLDLADIYGAGQCETVVGKALPAFSREKYQIVTKAGIRFNHAERFIYYDTTYDWITAKCRESIEKLNCGYIDLYLIHREDPLIDHHEVARAFRDLKKEGLIKEAGVSNFDTFKFNALNAVMEGTLRTNQIELSPACFEHFNSGMIDMLQSCNIHPMIWSPMAGGKIATDDSVLFSTIRKVCGQLAVKYQVSLNTIVYAWLLKHPVCTLPIVGSGKLTRMQEAIDALTLDLEREDWYRIYTASKQQTLR